MTFDYQAEAQLTKSDQFHGELITEVEFAQAFTAAITALHKLDKIKKALFYGKNFDDFGRMWSDSYIEILPTIACILTKQQSIDIIHSIIGKATEAGELLEALYAAMFEGKEFDVANFREEIGDGLWYDAIGLEAIGSSFQEVQTINIAKLRTRFSNKFTEFDANNRDLSNERKILETTDTKD